MALLAERELRSDRLSDHELDVTQSLFNEAERELELEPRCVYCVVCLL